MIVLLSIGAVLFYLIFVLNFGTAYYLNNNPVMYFTEAFKSGPGTFAFLTNLLLLGILIGFLIKQLSNKYREKNPFIFVFVSFFSLINTKLYFVSASDFVKAYEKLNVPNCLVAIIVFSIVATLYTAIVSICLFASGKTSYSPIKTHLSAVLTPEYKIDVGDVVKTKVSHQSGNHVYPVGTKGKVIESYPRSVIILVEEPNGNNNKIPLLKSEVEKVDESSKENINEK